MRAARELLRSAYDAAIAATHPDAVLSAHLPPPPPGHVIILAAGKAAASMAAVAEAHYLAHPEFVPPRVVGSVATRTGHAVATRFLSLHECGHPLPDAASCAAADEALRYAQQANADDLVLTLLSGGASANWTAPVSGITLADKQELTRALLRAGAPIAAINTVRKHLSRIKGGRLARAAAPASMVTCVISDVVGDDPSVIASGPTVADPTALQEARTILTRFNIEAPAAVLRALDESTNETPKPADPVFQHSRYHIVARPDDALAAAAKVIAAAGYEVVHLGCAIEGEARMIAADHARQALALRAQGRRVALISGGEATVTVRGRGRGGPNQEYALALLAHWGDCRDLCAFAGDTDGSDGGSGAADDPAGAFVDAEVALAATALALDPQRALDDNDATGFFAAAGGLVTTGPTRTNVNDLRIILIDPSR